MANPIPIPIDDIQPLYEIIAGLKRNAAITDYQMTDTTNKTLSTPLVLVIDDDETIRQLLIALLHEIEYSVISASNGLAALDMLKEHPVDLVITDIIMPGMEGLELVRNLKKYYPDIKIIAMSAYRASGQLDYLQHAKAFGVDQTFQKPFDVEQLLDTVKSLTTT